MLENEPTNGTDNENPVEETGTVRRTRRRSVSHDAPEQTNAVDDTSATSDDGGQAPPARRRTRARGSAASNATGETESGAETGAAPGGRSRTAAATFSAAEGPGTEEPPAPAPAAESSRRPAPVTALFVAPAPTEEPPPRARTRAEGEEATPSRGRAAEHEEAETAEEAPARTRNRRRRTTAPEAEVAEEAAASVDEDEVDEADEYEDEDTESGARRRRRRGRRGRGRGKGPQEDEAEETGGDSDEASDEDEDEEAEEVGDGMTRRRRRRRRRGSGTGPEETEAEDGVVTVVKIREPRPARDEVQGVSGSTRLEAKRQRRRDGRDQRRTRPSILSESEFLARREAVDRVMVIREKGDRTQIAVLEDGILVEHYVSRTSSGTMVGNVYLGKVQNVLPSMEAAFIDIGRGRNAVLYAGEVNWDVAGLEGKARSIESALKSGDSVLVQVTKDPIGHKGARLTSHIALSGRHLVYVPNGNASGISRKLSDVERKRLRDILKKLVPEGAGVIVRTAAEGASEDELERDIKRLSAQWSDIEAKVGSGGAPIQLYEEPDLVIRVVRDLFNEDFRELVVQGANAAEMVESYLGHVSPDLVARLRRHAATADVFAAYRIDEQIMKGLDRKVFLPSGGSLVIDRTEAMTVIDVNTGKYTGTGGNLEETVTRNNLEAAEEIVRQLRLRDLGGIIVIDFIDMVLESNRELVLRRLTECLGRDRTKHQVTEITSLGLVQMTRKRIGQGLLEAFSETCEHCKGRGVILHLEPVAEKRPVHDHVAEHTETPSSRRRGRRGKAGVTQTADEEFVIEDEPEPYAPEAASLDPVPEEAGAPEVARDAEEASAGADAAPEAEPASAAAGDAGSNGTGSGGSNGAVTTGGPVTTSWMPPATSSWVNLGATPAPAPDAPDEPVDLSGGTSPEIEALESELDSDIGRRRRMSRWRRS